MLWRVIKVVTNDLATDPVNQGVTVTLRDDDTRATATADILIGKSVITDPAAWTSVFCDNFNDTYTPNDFGCS